MRMISLIKTGLGTPVLSGPDSNQVTITDNGVGDYTITFDESFANSPCVMLTPVTANIVPRINTLANGSVRISTSDLGTAAIAPSDTSSGLTTAATVSSRTVGTLRNGDTVTITVNAAAANPTDTIIAAVTGDIDAVAIAITPNDGTNNGATPVNLTTAELVELITTNAVSGKTVTLTDTNDLLEDLRATGGGAENLANGGEGDGEVFTLANGADEVAPTAAEGDFHAMIIGADVSEKY